MTMFIKSPFKVKGFDSLRKLFVVVCFIQDLRFVCLIILSVHSRRDKSNGPDSLQTTPTLIQKIVEIYGGDKGRLKPF